MTLALNVPFLELISDVMKIDLPQLGSVDDEDVDIMIKGKFPQSITRMTEKWVRVFTEYVKVK